MHLVCFYQGKNPPNISLTSPLGHLEMEISLTFLGIEFVSQLLFTNQLTPTVKNIKLDPFTGGSSLRKKLTKL